MFQHFNYSVNSIRLTCINLMFVCFLDLCEWHRNLLAFFIYTHLQRCQGDRVTEVTGLGGEEMIANVYLAECT